MNKKVLRLAIPNIISNITVPLIGMVDVSLMGHLTESFYIAAVALGSVIFNILFLSFGFLRMSTTGFTAQAFGKENTDEINQSLQRPFIIALIIALGILLLQVPLANIGFSLLEGDILTKETAKSYYYTRIWSAPATLVVYVLMGWFVGMQDTRSPMIISIVVNLINIGFSILFVNYLHLDVEGVALGSVIADYAGLVLAIMILFRKYGQYLRAVPFSKLLSRNPLLQYFKTNSNIFIRSVILISALSYFTSKGASLGNDILAINSMMLQYFFVFSYFMDGFAYAAEALTGNYTGRNDKVLYLKTISTVFKWGWGLSLFFGSFYLGMHPLLIGILSDNQLLAEASKSYIWWMAAIPLTSFSAFLWDGIFVGSLATKQMRNAMIIAGLIVYIPAVIILVPFLGNHGLWLSFHMFMVTRSVCMWYSSANIAVTLSNDMND